MSYMREAVELTQKSLSLVMTLAVNALWGEIDWSKIAWVFDKPKEAGREFTQFLQNGCRLEVERIIEVNRGIPFKKVFPELRKMLPQLNPLWHFDDAVYKGGEDREYDLDTVTFRKGEASCDNFLSINGRDLDVFDFAAIWNQKELIPPSWRKHRGHLIFKGTELRTADGVVEFISIYRMMGKWEARIVPLG